MKKIIVAALLIMLFVYGCEQKTYQQEQPTQTVVTIGEPAQPTAEYKDLQTSDDVFAAMEEAVGDLG